MTLPPWLTPQARALLAEIAASPPSTYVRTVDRLGSINCGSISDERYSVRGCPALAKLRRLYNEWVEREYEKLNSAFHETGAWPEREDEPLMVEDADGLVMRLLHHPSVAPEFWLSVEDLAAEPVRERRAA